MSRERKSRAERGISFKRKQPPRFLQTGIETIATGTAIRERKRLRKIYGRGRWRKRKGFARIRLSDGTICRAEIHWYEAHGIGAKEHKIKRILEWLI